MSRKNNSEIKKKYHHWKDSARRKFRDDDREISLDFDAWFKLKQNKTCHYCNDNNATTLDRKNADTGYTKKNTVSCCNTCNQAKGGLNKAEFIELAYRITDNFPRPKVKKKISFWDKIKNLFGREVNEYWSFYGVKSK